MMNDNHIAFHHSLRGRMLVLMVLPMVVILSGVIAYMASNSFSAVRGKAESSLRLLAEQVAAEVEQRNAQAVWATPCSDQADPRSPGAQGPSQ